MALGGSWSWLFWPSLIAFILIVIRYQWFEATRHPLRSLASDRPHRSTLRTTAEGIWQVLLLFAVVGSVVAGNFALLRHVILAAR
jgi:hypothetical protein